MDFTPTQEQAAAQELAARIFGDLATHERLTAAGTGSDPELWKALCAAGLIGAVQEVGLLGLVLLLEEQGRTTAQVPFAVTCVYGLLAVSAHGSAEQRERLLPGIIDGSVVVSGAFPAQGGVRASAGGELTGTVPVVPWLRDATHVLVADADRKLWLVPTTGRAEWQPVELTAPWAAGRLVLEGTEAEQLGGSGAERLGGSGAERLSGVGSEHPAGPDAYADVLATARTAFAGLQAGVCAGSLARAVAHTNTREQFGRPLAAKQAVQLRAADAYMDTEAIRVTAYEAAWRRDTGLPYASHALAAAWWASEAGSRVVHAGQHLHGGAGADLDHPVHRHFLWGRQLDAYLGCGDELLQELGELIKEGEEAEAWDR
ncbi:acyl-CoA dehydrogenase family protein [Streptomyces sp. DG2A-72]|uniref:acyl-CoA dehydrogenase family protein n=1 Tax=Streptomyces sp. DG2A-72 TaxID=3051386 RepID=UPI00265C7F9B|nr:acyl-CoA dehydrogenase family protein [Streptomyces sp. DG2A-72]MDO0934523.1 acyl-CoA dehydrogenase family protein [Streptomyces sp. DG2A-72]